MKRLVLSALSLALISSIALAGVSKIRSNGNISGVPSYQVQCTSGSTYIIYKKNGTWYKGGSGHMGNKYNSWSKNEVADYVCR